MLDRDKHDQAEEFFEKVIAPHRGRRVTDRKYAKARQALALADAKLAKAELAASGFDVDRLQRFADERAAEHRRVREENQRRAVEASADTARGLLDIAPVIFPVEPIDAVIDEMLFIRTYADQGSILDSNIGPSDNWARYRMVGDEDYIPGTGRLSFFALWHNPQDEIAIIMARPQLVVNARLTCDAEWSGVASWFGMSSIAKAKVSARTTVWGMTAGVSSVVHERQLAENDIEGGFFGDDGAVGIALNELLPSSGVVVQANSTVMIEVEIFTEWKTADGKVTLDAESGSHRIDVPKILISHIGGSMPPNPQPGMITLASSVTPDSSGARFTITLTWAGASGSTVDIYQNGAKIATTANDNSFSVDVLAGTYTFRICETQSTLCSADISVTVP